MKKLLGRLGIIFVVVSLSGIAVTFYMHDKVSTYLQASIDKQKLLSMKKSPVTILVGGSNIAFGVDSDQLTATLKQKVINMGLHADLGLGYMLREVKPQLSDGDTVILSLEYEHFYGKLRPNSRTLTQLVLANPAAISLLSFPNDFIDVISHLYLPFKSIYFQYVARDQPERTVYSRANFTSNGDVVIPSWGSEKVYSANPNRRIPSADNINFETIQILNEFNEYARCKGTRVFLAFPPMPQPEFKLNKRQLSELYVELKDNLKMKILTLPIEQIFPVSEFFDTSYHLNTTGRKHRTQLLARSLNEFFYDNQ